jgi:hypothetical protein
MTLRGGSNGRFSSSLGASIERAFSAQMLALKGTPLPTQGRDDRRLLFTAIGEGLLEYLAERDADIVVEVTANSQTYRGVLRIPVARLSLGATGSGSARTARASGTRFPAGRVDLVWASRGVIGATAYASSAGAFGPTTLSRPGGLESGPQAVIARDAQGYETFAEIEL